MATFSGSIQCPLYTGLTVNGFISKIGKPLSVEILLTYECSTIMFNNTTLFHKQYILLASQNILVA